MRQLDIEFEPEAVRIAATTRACVLACLHASKRACMRSCVHCIASIARTEAPRSTPIAKERHRWRADEEREIDKIEIGSRKLRDRGTGQGKAGG